MRWLTSAALLLGAAPSECRQTTLTLQNVGASKSIFQSACAQINVHTSDRSAAGVPSKKDYIAIYAESVLEQQHSDEARARYFVQTGQEVTGPVWQFKPHVWVNGEFKGDTSKYAFEPIGEAGEDAQVSVWVDFLSTGDSIGDSEEPYRVVYHSAANKDPSAISVISDKFTLANHRPPADAKVAFSSASSMSVYGDKKFSVVHRRGKTSEKEWIGIYKEQTAAKWTDCEPDETPVAWQYVSGGLATFEPPKLAAGTYVAMLLADGKYFKLGQSKPFSVAPEGATEIVGGVSMLKSHDVAPRVWLPIRPDASSSLVAWNSTAGRVEVLAKVFAHQQKPHQWFNQLVVKMREQVVLDVSVMATAFGTMKVLANGKPVTESPPSEGMSQAYKLGHEGSMRAVKLAKTENIGSKRADMLIVKLGGRKFSIYSSNAKELAKAEEQASHAHLKIDFTDGLPCGAEGLFAELTGLQKPTEGTTAAFRPVTEMQEQLAAKVTAHAELDEPVSPLPDKATIELKVRKMIDQRSKELLKGPEKPHHKHNDSEKKAQFPLHHKHNDSEKEAQFPLPTDAAALDRLGEASQKQHDHTSDKEDASRTLPKLHNGSEQEAQPQLYHRSYPEPPQMSDAMDRLGAEGSYSPHGLGSHESEPTDAAALDRLSEGWQQQYPHSSDAPQPQPHSVRVAGKSDAVLERLKVEGSHSTHGPGSHASAHHLQHEGSEKEAKFPLPTDAAALDRLGEASQKQHNHTSDKEDASRPPHHHQHKGSEKKVSSQHDNEAQKEKESSQKKEPTSPLEAFAAALHKNRLKEAHDEKTAPQHHKHNGSDKEASPQHHPQKDTPKEQPDHEHKGSDKGVTPPQPSGLKGQPSVHKGSQKEAQKDSPLEAFAAALDKETHTEAQTERPAHAYGPRSGPPQKDGPPHTTEAQKDGPQPHQQKGSHKEGSLQPK